MKTIVMLMYNAKCFPPNGRHSMNITCRDSIYKIYAIKCSLNGSPISVSKQSKCHVSCNYIKEYIYGVHLIDAFLFNSNNPIIFYIFNICHTIICLGCNLKFILALYTSIWVLMGTVFCVDQDYESYGIAFQLNQEHATNRLSNGFIPR